MIASLWMTLRGTVQLINRRKGRHPEGLGQAQKVDEHNEVQQGQGQGVARVLGQSLICAQTERTQAEWDPGKLI